MRQAAVPVLLTLLLPLLAGGDDGPVERVGVAAQAGQETSVSREGDASPAQGPIRVHPEARRAIARLKSPFCPGFMLEVCPSPQAEALRDSLNALANQGVESDSLVALVLATHGEEWRAVPEARGRGLVAWLVPPVVLLLAVLGLILGLRHFTGPAAGGAGEGPEISEEERRRLDAAMQELDAEEEPLF